MQLRTHKPCRDETSVTFFGRNALTYFHGKLFVLLSILFICLQGFGADNEAQAQNRCPPGQSEITIFGVPRDGPPSCTSKLPSVEGFVVPPPVACKSDKLPKRFLPGLKVKMWAKLQAENGHRYINVGDGKLVKIYFGCIEWNNFFQVHNGERVVIKNARRYKHGDIGVACHNNKCGRMYLADLRPINPPPVAGRRADEDAGKIEGLDEKFYVVVPQGKKLYLFSEPKFSNKPLAKLSNGTPVTGEKHNHPNDPLWKKICTTKACGFAYSQFLKQGSPKDIVKHQGRPKKVITISAREIVVFADPDGFSKKLGSVYQGQIVDAFETVTNEEGVTWIRICKSGCGWVPTEDLK